MLKFVYRLFQKLTVHFKADAGDVPVLLCAEQISRAANLQITHGDFKARAELSELFHGLKSFFRRLAQNFFRAVNEVSKGHST